MIVEGVYVPAAECRRLAWLLAGAELRARTSGQDLPPSTQKILDEIRAAARATAGGASSGNGIPMFRREGQSGMLEPMAVSEVAERLKTSQRYVIHLVARGRLPGRKLRGRWLIDKPDVEAFAKER